MDAKLNNVLLGKNSACKNLTFRVSVTVTTEIQSSSDSPGVHKETKRNCFVNFDR